MVARTWKIGMTQEQLQELASAHWRGHAALIGEGYELGGKSGFWRSSNGTVTGRLVYRLRQVNAGVSTVAVTIKGIPLQYA